MSPHAAYCRFVCQPLNSVPRHGPKRLRGTKRLPTPYFESTVRPGQSSVRNGEAGRAAAFESVHFGSSFQP